MSLFVISDLHLSTNDSTNKSMEVFGARWTDYVNKIKKNWNSVVAEHDTVIIPGDISWEMKLDSALSDLKFIDELHGTKLLGKGNHDFWWCTEKKMTDFFESHSLSTLTVLYNNAYIVEDRIICGSRGWFPDHARQITTNDTDYNKIINRECTRLRLSLTKAAELQRQHMEEYGAKLEILAFLHFPPVWGDLVIRELVDVLHEFDIKKCYYGHIHNTYSIPQTVCFEDISMTLTSADFLGFCPLRI